MSKPRHIPPAAVMAVLLAVLALTAYLASAPQGNRIYVACVGDSITEGSSYVHDLERLLGGNYSVGNFGTGFSSVSLATPKPYINQQVFVGAKNFHPNIVIIMLGTNDARTDNQGLIGNFSQDFKQLIGEFKTLSTKPQVYLVVPPPILDNTLGLNSTILEQQVIPQIRQIANQTSTPLIDFHQEMATHPEYFEDGVHPTVEGSAFIAEKVFEAIKTQ